MGAERRSDRGRRAGLLGAVAVVVVVVGAVLVVGVLRPGKEPSRRVLHVSAAAASPGDGSEVRPYPGIEQALDAAGPGDEVRVGPGDYPPFATRHPGTPGAPIRIVGRDARLRGPGGGVVVEIAHDQVSLEGFDVADGDVLIRVAGASGVRIFDNTLHDAGSECVRLRDGASDNEVARNRIERCGTRDFELDADRKNGEGVYIGVAPEQLDGEAPGAEATARNRIIGNELHVLAECVDIKEGSLGTLVEANVCTGSQDPDGAGFSSRGDETTFRANVSTDHAGAGIRLGGDDDDDGVDNSVVDNRLVGNAGYGLKVERFPQARICGNEVSGNAKGATNGEADPTQSCSERG